MLVLLFVAVGSAAPTVNKRSNYGESSPVYAKEIIEEKIYNQNPIKYEEIIEEKIYGNQNKYEEIIGEEIYEVGKRK